MTSPPIRDGWVQIEDGRIAAFGRWADVPAASTPVADLGRSVILPGLVNAHVHLELSWMRGRIGGVDDFPGWIRSVMDLRAACELDHAPDRGAAAAIIEARSFGTALLGDISNTLSPSPVLQRERMPALVFHEVLGFSESSAEIRFAEAVDRLSQVVDSPEVRHSMAPHAPYSVSPALFERIRGWLLAYPGPSSVHAGESAAELQFLRDGTGPFRELLEELGTWDPAWRPPACGPVEYLARLDLIAPRVLVVHGVHLTDAELELLARAGATLVTCPRGNVGTRAGTPPIAAFFRSGVRVAVGTDSLASVPDLNLFAELAMLRALAPNVPARTLLESATLSGAAALDRHGEFGSIESGKRAALIAVELGSTAARAEDAEEILVSGIAQSRIQWLST